jgi:hypothetical protein
MSGFAAVTRSSYLVAPPLSKKTVILALTHRAFLATPETFECHIGYSLLP